MGRGRDRSGRGDDDDLAKMALGLSVLSNSVRARTITGLARGQASFTELLEHTGLDPTRQCGLLDYHLQYLQELGVVTRVKGGYALTERGKGISSLLTGLTHLAKQTELGKEDEGMAKRGMDLEVRKLSQKDVESFLDFFIARWEIDPKYRDAEREHITMWMRDRNGMHFVAWRGGKIVGWLHGKIHMLSVGTSIGRPVGEEGWIDDIVVEKPKVEGREADLKVEEIAEALIDACEEFLSFRSGCVGVKAMRIVPESLPYHPEIFRLLQRKGFLVANIAYEMEKRFPGRLGKLVEAHPQ